MTPDQFLESFMSWFGVIVIVVLMVGFLINIVKSAVGYDRD